MTCKTAENRVEETEGNADGLPIQWEEVGSSRKYAGFLVFDAMCCAEFAEKLLKSRCNYVIIELELYRLSQKKCENVRKCCL